LSIPHWAGAKGGTLMAAKSSWKKNGYKKKIPQPGPEQQRRMGRGGTLSMNRGLIPKTFPWRKRRVGGKQGGQEANRLRTGVVLKKCQKSTPTMWKRGRGHSEVKAGAPIGSRLTESD